MAGIGRRLVRGLVLMEGTSNYAFSPISLSFRLTISEGRTSSTSASFTTVRTVGLRKPLSTRLI